MANMGTIAHWWTVHGLKRLTGIWFASVVLLFSESIVLQGQVPGATESQVKAVFLFNFTRFVEWPISTLQRSEMPFVIGIVGDDPFGAYFDEIVRGEKVNGHPLVIQRYQNWEKIGTCHILFINLNQTDQLGRVLANLKGRSVLTVSDAATFIQQGGMIRFFNENNKIRFQINPQASRSEELEISSKLLNLAEIVEPKLTE